MDRRPRRANGTPPCTYPRRGTRRREFPCLAKWSRAMSVHRSLKAITVPRSRRIIERRGVSGLSLVLGRKKGVKSVLVAPLKDGGRKIAGQAVLTPVVILPARVGNLPSIVTGPGRRMQCPGCLPQQQRDRQTESEYHQAQETQAPLKPSCDALQLGESAQDRAGLLLKCRPAHAPLP